MSDFPEVNDHLVANPDNYNVTQNADGTWTIRPTWVDNPAEVLQEGTPVNAAFLAKIPEAIDAIDTKVTSQLADKVTKGQAAVTDIDKNLGKFDQTYMTDEFLQQIAGTTPVNATPADYSLVEKKFAVPVLLGAKSKNLFNKDTVTNAFYVDYTTGNLLANATKSASDFIPVLASTTYTKTDNFQFAFYDSNKAYISGLASGRTFTTPANTAFVRLTVDTAALGVQQLELGSVATAYESYINKLRQDVIPNSIITKPMLSFEVLEGVPSKNLFDKLNVTQDRYISYTTGAPVLSTTYVASDFIPVSANTQYTKTDNNQFAFYNADKVYISGLISGRTFTTPANTAFVRISVKKTELEAEQLEVGAESTTYVSYGEKLPLSSLPSELATDLSTIIPNKITVAQDGSGDFTNLRSALESLTDAGPNKRYSVYLKEGTYNIFADYTTEEIDNASFIGLRIPNYVDLIGLGKKENTIIRGELADTFSTTTKNRVALSKFGEGRFENLTIIGKNTRYALHDDYNYPDTKRTVINCDFIKEAGGGLNVAYGAGSYSGMEFEFKDSYFYVDATSYPFSFHNNVSLAKSCKWRIENCQFESKNGEWVVRFGSMGSGHADTIEMIGCKLGGKILLNEEVAGSGVGIDFELKGYGNSVVPVDIVQTSATPATYEFVNETERVYNASAGTIAKGSLVKITSKGKPVTPLLSTDSAVLYHGIAIEDIAAGATGVIRKRGYLRVADTGLTVAIGDKIGIVNGALAVVTTGDYIGYIELANYITLK